MKTNREIYDIFSKWKGVILKALEVNQADQITNMQHLKNIKLKFYFKQNNTIAPKVLQF